MTAAVAMPMMSNRIKVDNIPTTGCCRQVVRGTRFSYIVGSLCSNFIYFSYIGLSLGVVRAVESYSAYNCYYKTQQDKQPQYGHGGRHYYFVSLSV
jgi:hypothetical protein